jgi:hypothetical protein
MRVVLQYPRLSPTVKQAMMFNMYMHSPMTQSMCTPHRGCRDPVDYRTIIGAHTAYLGPGMVVLEEAQEAHAEQVCLGRPILSPVNKQNGFRYDYSVHQKLLVITSISGTDFLADHNSDRYKAACWTLYDDPYLRDATHPLLVQRYAMSVFYYDENAYENENTRERFEIGRTEELFPYLKCVRM